MKDYKCSLCLKTVAHSIKGLGSHYRRIHAMSLVNNIKLDTFSCAQGQCQKKYFTFRNLSRHSRTSHDSEAYDTIDSVPPSTAFGANSVSIIENSDEKNVSEVETNIETFKSFKSSCDLKHHAAKMVLGLQCQSNVTYAVAKECMNSTHEMVKEVSSSLKQEVVAFLENHNISIDKSATSELLSKFDELSDPFHDLKSTYQQINYYKNSFGFIEPKEISLGQRSDQVFDSFSQEYNLKVRKNTAQYIPIIELLTSVVNNVEVFNYLKTDHKSIDGNLRSYNDGNAFKNHQFFKKYPQALQLQLYFDDFETCNPLGSKTKIHEVGAFYFTILNLPPKFNSKLKNIHLLALYHSQDIKTYGFDKVLQPFMNDLKHLESDEGVPIKVFGNSYILRASLAMVCADGLATHSLLGLLAPSANRFCRLCIITREESQFQFTEFQKRNKSEYDDHVIQSSTCREAATSSGVKQNSALHASRYFHMTENFCFDAMHDLLEGICPMEIKLILNHLIFVEPTAGLTVEILNHRLNSFMYGLSDTKNKPSSNFTKSMIHNSRDYLLKQKAAQVWCLMRVLPFILFDLLPFTNEFFGVLNLLSRIMEIVFSPVLSNGLLSYLDELCVEHHEKFKELFPNVKLINKHHHLLHYSDCIFQFGPMIRMWCMRYEAKHNFFKTRAKINNNFKNITKSLATCHQLSHCSSWLVHNKSCNHISFTGIENVFIASCLSCLLLKEMGFKDNSYVSLVKTCSLYGTKYRRGVFVCVESSKNNRYPIFGKVLEIIFSSDVLFYVEVWSTAEFHSFLNAYCIKSINCKYKLIKYDELADYYPYSAWIPFGSDKKYISLRHVIM